MDKDWRTNLRRVGLYHYHAVIHEDGHDTFRISLVPRSRWSQEEAARWRYDEAYVRADIVIKCSRNGDARLVKFAKIAAADDDEESDQPSAPSSGHYSKARVVWAGLYPGSESQHVRAVLITDTRDGSPVKLAVECVTTDALGDPSWREVDPLSKSGQAMIETVTLLTIQGLARSSDD